MLERIRHTFGLSEKARKWMPVLAAIFVLGFLARLGIAAFFVSADPDFVIDDDSTGYLSLADNLQAGNGFAWDTGMPFTPDSFRVPLYPAFLAAHNLLFGSYIPVLVTQIFLSLIIALLSVKIADRFLKSPGIGAVAAGVFLFMPFSLLVSERYVTQVLYTVLATAAAWFWLSYLENGKWRAFAGTALSVPLSALVRPISIFFTAPFIASLAVGWWWKKISLKKALASGAILIVCFLAVIAPWLYRNYSVFGLPYLSSITAVQLYFYDAPAVYATSKDISYEEARTYLNEHIANITGVTFAEDPVSYTELSPYTKIMRDEGARFFFADIPALIETRALQFFKFFTRDGIRYWLEHYSVDTYGGWALVPIIFERAVMFLFSLGFFWYAAHAFFSKNLPGFALCLIVLYFAALSGVMSSAGLRYPAEPLLLLLGTAGLLELYLLLKQKFFKTKAA
jgi:hypothetical protein